MSGKPKVVLHWLDKSRSQRILWLIYELDIPNKADFSLQVYKRTKELLAPDSLKRVHSLGKSPVIEVTPAGSTQSVVIAESAAIMEYLAFHFGGKHFIPARFPDGQAEGIGAETETWLRYSQLLHYAEGSLMPFLVMALLTQSIKEARGAPFFVRPVTRIIGQRIEDAFVTRNLAANFEFLEKTLSTSPQNGAFFCGPEMTLVDFMLIYPLESAQGRAGLTKEKNPQICAWVERCQERTAFKAAVQKIIDETGEYNPKL